MKKVILVLVYFSLFSCNKDFDDYFDQEFAYFPKEIDSVDRISKEDSLYGYLGLVSKNNETELTDVGCIEFIYPFVLFRFDDSQNYKDQVSVSGNENFTSILDELENGHSIGLSYPISGHLIDGTAVMVNSNEELQQSLETCIEEELEIIIGNCNTIVEDCIWKVTGSDPEGSPYINSFFTLREDGSVVFSVLQQDEEVEEENQNEEISIYENEIGTWIFNFIGADLHMNINFGPLEQDENGLIIEQDTIKSDWNFDWKINYIDLDKIAIEKSYIQTISSDNGDTEEIVTEHITLEKECEEDDSVENIGD